MSPKGGALKSALVRGATNRRSWESSVWGTEGAITTDHVDTERLPQRMVSTRGSRHGEARPHRCDVEAELRGTQAHVQRGPHMNARDGRAELRAPDTLGTRTL